MSQVVVAIMVVLITSAAISAETLTMSTSTSVIEAKIGYLVTSYVLGGGSYNGRYDYFSSYITRDSNYVKKYVSDRS